MVDFVKGKVEMDGGKARSTLNQANP